MTAQTNAHTPAGSDLDRSATICDLIMDIGQANPLLTFVDIYAMVTSQLDALDTYAQEWDGLTASAVAEHERSSRLKLSDSAADLCVTYYPCDHVIYLDGPKREGMSPAQARAAARLLLAMANDVDPVCAPLAPAPDSRLDVLRAIDRVMAIYDGHMFFLSPLAAARAEQLDDNPQIAPRSPRGWTIQRPGEEPEVVYHATALPASPDMVLLGTSKAFYVVGYEEWHAATGERP